MANTSSIPLTEVIVKALLAKLMEYSADDVTHFMTEGALMSYIVGACTTLFLALYIRMSYVHLDSYHLNGSRTFYSGRYQIVPYRAKKKLDSLSKK